MSNAPFQSLLMDSNAELPEPETPTCVADQYYSCGPENDPYWDNVILMCHFDTDLTDSSLVANTLTAVNSAAVSASQVKFGAGALSYPGLTDYVTFPNSSNFQFTGDFTIEVWMYPTTTGFFQNIVRQSTDTNFWFFGRSNTGALRFGNGATAYLGASVLQDEWTHTAVTRQGDTLRFFTNGLHSGTHTVSGTIGITTGTGEINGQNLPSTGFIDDLRITKGVARYTGNFTIPTAAFPDAQEVSTATQRILLDYEVQGPSGQNLGHYIDKSPVSAITYRYNDLNPSTNALYKKWGDYGVAQSAGGLQLGRSHKLVLGTADFFLDFWFTQINGFPIVDRCLLDAKTSGSLAGFRLYASRGGASYQLSFQKNDGSYVDSGVAVTDNTQYYCAVYRIAGTTYVQQDSTVVVSFADTTDYAEHTWFIGNNLAQNQTFNGSFDEFSLRSETVSSPVSVPVVGYTPFYDPRTILSLHAEDTADSSCYQEKTVTLTGSATVSTDQAKYGLSSFYIPNTGVSAAHGVVVTDHQDFDFGTLDFTIECWAYRNANTYTGRLFTGINSTPMYAEVGTDGLLDVVWSSSAGTSSRTDLVSVPLTQWNHFAFQRRGGTVFEVFLNGVLVDSVAVAASATLASTGDLYWGRTSASSATSWNGYIDEINIVRGAARYLPAGFDTADLAWCDSTTAGGQIATSGTEYPRTLSLTTGQGSIGLLNHYVTLSGQATTAAAGRAFLSNVSSPSGVSRNYTLTRTFSASTTGTYTITGQIFLATTGALQVSNANNALEIYNQNWLTPTGAGVSSDYEIRVVYSSGSGAFTLGLSQFGDGTWVPVDSTLSGTLTFSGSLAAASTSVGATAALTFYVRPRSTSPLYDPSYSYAFTLTLNYALLKPASAASTYPDLASSSYASDGNTVLEFRADGTVRVAGAVTGRWIDASSLLPGIANQFKLEVSTDPIPAGYTRVSNAAVRSYIKADLSTTNKFNIFALGAAASTREAFTVRSVPLISNPRYGEAGYYGVHTITIDRVVEAGF